MKKNKLVLFDWGNIVESNLTGYTIHTAFNDLVRELGCKKDDPYCELYKYQLSAIPTLEEFEKTFNQMKIDFNLEGNFNNFMERYIYYFDKIDYYKEVRDYEISLRDKCYIGIFSNLNILDRKRLDKQVGLSNYDYVFLSYEMELRKPDINLYLKVDDNLPFDKKDILFIDDRKNNVESAKEIGWNAVQLNGLELDKIKEVCEEFLND